ncbi:MAG TPA: hypothetical protein VOA41_15065 [Candidatus Dormibacteraeota bacterium]|nr:hypothetical protein [Candidatus Dormibacteraeota bacterium]
MSENTNHRRATLLVIAVFLIGVGLGAVGSYGIMKKTFAAPNRQRLEAEKRARWVEHLTSEASLTADQQKDLDKILIDLQARYKVIHDREVPQFEQARQQAREQIRAILTPAQKPKFDDFLRRLDEERGKNSRF